MKKLIKPNKRQHFVYAYALEGSSYGTNNGCGGDYQCQIKKTIFQI